MAAGKSVGWVPVEHHAFVYRGQSLAFNVNTLEVHRLNEEQLRLLRFSSEVRSLEDRCPGGSPVGLSPRRVNDVLKALRDMGLVVPEGTPIPEARRPSMAYDYTFMVNVAQICNLRCLYCYTQEGRFDFTGGQRTRMIPDDARRLALAVRRWFPQATVTCFHFYGGEPLINFPAIQALVEETRSNEQTCCYEFAITTNGTLLTPRIADFWTSTASRSS
jgi:uncharacterized protein